MHRHRMSSSYILAMPMKRWHRVQMRCATHLNRSNWVKSKLFRTKDWRFFFGSGCYAQRRQHNVQYILNFSRDPSMNDLSFYFIFRYNLLRLFLFFFCHFMRSTASASDANSRNFLFLRMWVRTTTKSAKSKVPNHFSLVGHSSAESSFSFACCTTKALMCIENVCRIGGPKCASERTCNKCVHTILKVKFEVVKSLLWYSEDTHTCHLSLTDQVHLTSFFCISLCVCISALRCGFTHRNQHKWPKKKWLFRRWNFVFLVIHERNKFSTENVCWMASPLCVHVSMRTLK